MHKKEKEEDPFRHYFSSQILAAVFINGSPGPSREVITFPGFVDCIYLDAPKELQLDNGLGDVITIRNTNWSDAVMWNPHLKMESCYKDFVCVENAKIGKVQLEPEQSWVAEQQIAIS